MRYGVPGSKLKKCSYASSQPSLLRISQTSNDIPNRFALYLLYRKAYSLFTFAMVIIMLLSGKWSCYRARSKTNRKVCQLKLFYKAKPRSICRRDSKKNVKFHWGLCGLASIRPGGGISLELSFCPCPDSSSIEWKAP